MANVFKIDKQIEEYIAAQQLEEILEEKRIKEHAKLDRRSDIFGNFDDKGEESDK